MRTPQRALIALAVALMWGLPTPGQSETCTRETVRKVVDEAGARLRVLTAETQPRILATLRKLKEKKGWTDAEGDEKASGLMTDDRTVALDAKAAELLTRIDELSEASSAEAPNCARLADLEAASSELQATIRSKAQYILARLQQEMGGDTTAGAGPGVASPGAPAASSKALPPGQTVSPTGRQKDSGAVAGSSGAGSPDRTTGEQAAATKQPGSAALPAPPPQAGTASPGRALQPPPPLRGRVEPPAANRSPVAPPPAVASRVPPTPAPSWTTETSSSPPIIRDALPPPAAANAPPIEPAPPSASFSREDIQEASRGFFGTISGGLGSVMEYAFSTLGRPTGYVLGNEGGGAFIAGVRYGKGTLFLHDGTKREVYWHGPSIGYDFGASGSKTIFLVYNLRRDLDIFTSFSGVDGSAYLVGGVGMTVLTDGHVVMAPIRSGVGLRLGANIGYVRFTARQTWNPF